MKEKTLVITGMGAVTPVGIGVDAYWRALIDGKCGVGPITRFDASGLPVQIAAELKGFDPADYMPKQLARTMDPFMQFAFAAAEEALADSALPVGAEPDRIGIVMGTAMDGVTTVAQTQAAFDAGRRV
ncbi:MAG TPA: beta-ketoacyl-[acyl-carrier-protein] synthase II, partial [Candidatus Agathobaculum stercoravium]|nr:beta-ketoacyl-[acyl-carrier-protein] synthase II [Candidatus Agathobaculum stercoravium]